MRIQCPIEKEVSQARKRGQTLKICPPVALFETVYIRIFPVFRCIRREMGLVFIQHTAGHTFIDQDRLWRSRRREDQFGAGIGFPFQNSRTYAVHERKSFSDENGCDQTNVKNGRLSLLSQQNRPVL